MLTRAFLHCRGIGPRRLQQLQGAGVHCWRDAVATPERVPNRLRESVLAASHDGLMALDRDDIGYFVARLDPRDKWRIAAHYFSRLSFFDIETEGLEYDARVTLISCWHRGQLHQFLEHENLDDFLDLLDDVELLASFNGASFDVPRVLDCFHLPQLPCPHLDLRWAGYHQGWRGGLKRVAQREGVERPSDLGDADGSWAIYWWRRWRDYSDVSARDQLIRYCSADVLLLRQLTSIWAGQPISPDQLWRDLPRAASGESSDPPAPTWDIHSPSQLRGLRRLTG